MITLKYKTRIIPLELSKDLCNSFSASLMFYLFHQKDERNFFIVLALIDFKNNQLILLDTFLPENEKIVSEKDPQKKIFKILGAATPHQIIFKEKEQFFLFCEQTSFFYCVNLRLKKINVYTAHDILPGLESDVLPIFSPTVYLYDKDHFIFGISKLLPSNNEGAIVFCKSTLNFDSISYLEEIPGLSIPHTIRPYKDVLYNAIFDTQRLIDIDTGKIYSPISFYSYVLKDLFKEYCEFIDEEFNEEKFNQVSVNRSGGSYIYFTLPSDFEYFLKYKYNFDSTNIFNLLFKIKKYHLKGTNGNILAYNMKTKESKQYLTTKTSPAHFEIDEDTDDIYISNHNFGLSFKGQFSMLGPAAIDKFHIDETGLRKISTFEHNEGYRFTTHILFTYKSHKYIATMGQPNRLYFIDAETMQLEYFDTIEDKILEKQDNLHEYLISTPIESDSVIKCIQVSQDGEIIFILGHENIYFYSFPKKEIIEVLPYKNYAKNYGMDNLYRRSAHCHWI